MLFSDLVKDLVSGRTITDDGLGAAHVRLNRRGEASRLQLARYLSRFRHFRRVLARLDIHSRELLMPGPVHDEESLQFRSDDPRSDDIARAAFAAGVYYGKMNATFMSHCLDIVTHHRSTKAGNAGGEAKRRAAHKSRLVIRKAYARWASRPENAKKPESTFIKAFGQEPARRKTKRVSPSTIRRALSDLNEEIVNECARMKAGAMPAAKRDRAVATAMKDRAGVTLATVRRALK